MRKLFWFCVGLLLVQPAWSSVQLYRSNNVATYFDFVFYTTAGAVCTDPLNVACEYDEYDDGTAPGALTSGGMTETRVGTEPRVYVTLTAGMVDSDYTSVYCTSTCTNSIPRLFTLNTKNQDVNVVEWAGDAATASSGNPDVNVESQDNIDFGATQKASIKTEAENAIETYHLDHVFAVDYDPASKPGVGTALLNELIESNAGVSRYTAAALAEAPSGGTGLTAEQTRAALGGFGGTIGTYTAGGPTVTLDNGPDAAGSDDVINDTYTITFFDNSDGDEPFCHRNITDWAQATKTATLGTACEVALQNSTDTYVVMPNAAGMKHVKVSDATSDIQVDASGYLNVNMVAATAAGVQDFFTVDSGETSATAVEGSVVKETADGVSGGTAAYFETGTAAGSAASSITLAETAYEDDSLINAVVLVTSGDCAGQSQIITDYVKSTDVATVQANWAVQGLCAFADINGATYELYTSIGAVPDTTADAANTILAADCSDASTTADTLGAICTDWENAGRLDAILDISRTEVGQILADTGTDGVVVASLNANAIGAGDIATGGIEAGDFAVGAIDAAAIATDAIGAAELAANSITSSEIADNSIDAGAIATDAITATELAANAIGASELATDAIGAAEIAADAVGVAEAGFLTDSTGFQGADVAAILVDTGTTIPGTITTAQTDLDTLTGVDGATLATDQANYAPATDAALTTHDGKLDTVDGIVDNILIDTGEIGAAGVGLTNVGVVSMDVSVIGQTQLDYCGTGIKFTVQSDAANSATQVATDLSDTDYADDQFGGSSIPKRAVVFQTGNVEGLAATIQSFDTTGGAAEDLLGFSSVGTEPDAGVIGCIF